ncbi:MAG: hypothetical protein HOH19_09130 [Kordiimonadaceae bacterium]|jgi:uncharacterized heparinase superfamily protein|nr:hypothetical protein [Kordiimonadaceae bacterium]MBT6032726.1 hypothetical protein [Kordiimonadaceae bacterium]
MAQLRRKSVSSMGLKMQNPIAKAFGRAKHSGFYHDLSLRGKHPLRLLGTPKDLWPGSVTMGTQMVAGKIIAAGNVLENPNHDQNIWPKGEIWLNSDLDESWLEYLHSFNWLRDLNQAVDRNGAKKRAEELTLTWIDQNTQWGEVSWRADVVGLRISNWLIFAPLIMDTDDVIYRSRVLDILARSARHLMKVSSELPDGPDSLKAIIGLILSGLYIPFGDGWLKEGLTLLKFALGKEVLADGGIRSRNPQELLHIYMQMVTLRDSFAGMGQRAPDFLNIAIRKIALNLRTIVHGDGKVPLFNGATILNHEDIFTCLQKNDEDNLPVTDLEQSGYSRIENGGTVILQDVGPPAEVGLSRHCHSGALSFEMSRGTARMIVNCGDSRFTQEKQLLMSEIEARSTAAHSTLVLNEQNSSALREDGLIGNGITKMSSKRYMSEGHIMLEASHDGYNEQYGITHRRLLYLKNTGEDLRGEDILFRNRVENKVGPLPFAVRFHLHPEVMLEKQDDQDKVHITLVNGEMWTFLARGAALSLEDSVYFGVGGKSSHSQQIVLSANASEEQSKVFWSFRRET